MPKLTVTEQEARDILWEENEDFETVSDEVVDTSYRWSEIHSVVFKRLSDKTYWETTYSAAKTEQQDETPFEYDKTVDLYQVEQVEVKVMVWKTVKKCVLKK